MVGPTNNSLRCDSMGTIISGDVVPIADLEVDPGRIVRRAADELRPVLVTGGGRGVAVVQSLVDYETS